MASLSRTVEGWMGDTLYNRLGDQPNIERTWNLLRDVVGNHLLGSEFVPVPFIESAVYYNQLFVFTKKQSFLSAIGLKPPTYKVVGNLDYLVNRTESSWDPEFDFSPWDIADGHNMYGEYNLRIRSNQLGVHKFVEFTALRAHARSVVQPPIPGAVAIYRNLLEELHGVNTVYVITDVVLASSVTLLVRIDAETVNFTYDRDMPIGFRYKKYRLRNDGTFVAELPTSLKIHEYEAIWLQPLPQPIPIVPVWDCMRRRCNGGVRKMRSNLTIPPLDAPPANGRRPRREEDIANRQIRNNNLIEVPPQNQQAAARVPVAIEALRFRDGQED